ncbi:HAD family hydrolase [Streptomyces rubradiris]|uniref:HAD family hydrolase n=1 Tax=Streptomyces rubradiris TaxID=285531 RepID=UPI0036E636E8
MKRAALFDLDGVLADSHQAMRATLAGFATFHLGRRVTLADLPEDAAISSHEQVLADLGVTGALNEEAWEAAAATATLAATVFPYVPGTLTALRAQGIATGLVTSRAQRRVPWLLGPAILDLLDVIVCRDDAPLKPAPDGILLALHKLSVAPGDAVFLGDTESDIRAGLAAGVTALGAGWGFTSPERLRHAGAHQVLADPAEILPAVLAPAQTDHPRRSGASGQSGQLHEGS